MWNKICPRLRSKHFTSAKQIFHSAAISLARKGKFRWKKEHCFRNALFFWRRHPDLNWGIEVLQTSALPLGYGAVLNCTLSLSKKCQLNLIGIKRMERMTRLELATSTLARWRSTGWATSAQLVPPAGIEPATRGFSVRCSTNWATEANIWKPA